MSQETAKAATKTTEKQYYKQTRSLNHEYLLLLQPGDPTLSTITALQKLFICCLMMNTMPLKKSRGAINSESSLGQ